MKVEWVFEDGKVHEGELITILENKFCTPPYVAIVINSYTLKFEVVALSCLSMKVATLNNNTTGPVMNWFNGNYQNTITQEDIFNQGQPVMNFYTPKENK